MVTPVPAARREVTRQLAADPPGGSGRPPVTGWQAVPGSPDALAAGGSPGGPAGASSPDELAGLELALGVARQLATAPDVGAALVGGGLAAGLGNRSSDVDIYLVGDGLTASRRQLALATIRVDVHQLPSAELEALLRRTADANLTGALDSTRLSEADLTLAIRLRSARIAAGAGYITPLLAWLDERHLTKLAIGRWLAAAGSALEDLAGQQAALRQDGRLGADRGGEDCKAGADAAVLCARSALLAAGKAVAAACGDLHDGGKWVFRQLERSAPQEFALAEFSDLMRCDPLAGGLSIADLTGFTQTCLIAAATLGWQGVPLDGWPAWTPGSGPLRRTPGCYPLAYDEALLIAGPDRRWLKMAPDIALIWGLCTGVTADEVTCAAARLRPSAAVYSRLSSQRCHAIVDRLAESGLVLAT